MLLRAWRDRRRRRQLERLAHERELTPEEKDELTVLLDVHGKAEPRATSLTHGGWSDREPR